MYNQSTKHWKLGALLVVGLVLMAGLFVNGVLAHNIDDPDTSGIQIGGPAGGVKVSAVRSGFVEDTSITLRVVYTATEVLADPNPDRDDTTNDATYGRIRVTLPSNWGPATGDIILTDEDPTVPYALVRASRSVVLDPDPDNNPDTTTAAGLTILGSTTTGWVVNIDVNHMVRGNTVTLDFHNLDLPMNEREALTVIEASVQVTVVSDGQDNSDIARDSGTPTHAPTSFSPKVFTVDPAVGSDTQPTIMVLEKKLGDVAITNSVPESTLVDLVIRYTATADLANLGNPDAFPVIAPTYGRIKVILPDGWGPETDLSVKRTGSRGVIFSSDELTPTLPSMTDGMTDGWMIDIDVDHMENRDRVTITFPQLMIPMIDRPDLPSATELKDLGTIYINTADRVININDLDTENYVLSKFSPKVAYDALTETGQDNHPTITVKEQRLGKITVGPDPVIADTMVALTVKYVATSALAVPDPKATAIDDMNSTYGRISVTLPDEWVPSDTIVVGRVPGEPNATYLSVATSRGVILRKSPTTDAPDALSVDGGTINIDVDGMKSSQYVTLTVHNLRIGMLPVPRTDRYLDIMKDELMDKVEIEVYSNTFMEETDRDFAVGDNGLLRSVSFTPKVAYDATVAPPVGSDTQPTVTVNRKTLGELTVAPTEVTAGSNKDFTITYKATEAMEAGVIEVKLPVDWDAPRPYQIDDLKPKRKDVKKTDPSYVYLGGSASRLEGTKISVINGDDDEAYNDGTFNVGVTASQGWFVRIELGTKGLSRGGAIELNYWNVTVQRTLTTDAAPASIEVFSEAADDNTFIVDIPQYPVADQANPVADQAKGKITVKPAADGSGVVTFEFDGLLVPALTDTVKHNTDASIPAGIVADDALDLIVIYTPDGDMGAGEFEVRLPSGWDAAAMRISGEDDPKRSGNTVTAKLPEHFGEHENDALEITLEDITVPNKHGNHKFRAKSENAGGSLKQLSLTPDAFVGNAEAAGDTVKVEITPAAAYQNQDNVDFEITLTANGPMHDSEIQITVPDGLGDLEGDPTKSTEANHVRRVSASVSGVEVSVGGPADVNMILVKTGKLNAGGKIKVRLDNVDLDGVSTDLATGFRVGTRTRGPESMDADDNVIVDLSDEIFMAIKKDDDSRSIVGGLIRTVAGSGMMVVEPATVEQGSRNKNFKLTFTATTDLPDAGMDLVIAVPSVIETEIQEKSSANDGYVSTSTSTSKFHKDVEADDQLVISGSTITWTKIVLDRGEKFITNIKRVDLLGDTGDFPWETTLADAALPAADNKPMVVVGTMEDDVVFEVVDESDIPDSNPSYPASSMQSIRFKFTTTNTAVQPGGRLWFTVPVGWSLPSLTDKVNRATVGILALNDDGDEIFPTKLPDTKDPDTKDSTAGEKMVLSVSGRSVILSIGAKGGLAEDGSVTIRYGTADLTATGFPVKISSSAKGTAGNDEDGLAIRGHFRVSDDFRQRDAGTIWVDVTNVVDGSGTAALSSSPTTVRAGSKRNTITVTFTGTGTMDGGAVRLTIPEDWGAMQDDPLELNHVDVDVSGTGAALEGDPEIIDDGLAVVANLKTFGKSHKATFTYGGGTGGRDSRGAEAQADIGEATFMVESMGSGDGDFEEVTNDKGEPFASLTVVVKGAESGSGEGEVEIVKNKSGEGLYDGETDVDENMMQVHAGDDSTYLVFTYTPSQTIAEGQLRFAVPSTWTPPQRDATGEPGYTYFEEIGGAVVTNETYDLTTQSVVADIALTLDDQIKIHYGWYDTENGGAEAPSGVPTGGYSQFAIAVKGTVDEEVAFENIDGEDLIVRVRVQRSGGGMAAASPMTVNAGDVMSTITVTYTADGQVDNGQLKLTIPGTSEDWDAPTMDNVTIIGGGSSTAARFGGDHTAAELLALAAVATDDVDLGAMAVLVDNVMLAGGETVTFMYTSAMAQGTTGAAAFAVAIDGGDGPDTGPKAVGGMTVVTVDHAAPGSGMAMATTDGIVLPGSPENTLTFTYTVAGEAEYPADVRVTVSDDWTPVVSSNYTVTHKRAGRTHLDMVEKKAPIDGAMVARVISGEKVLAGDEIIFELTNVTAPATAGSYPFAVTFRGQPIAANPMVIVQSAEASMLAIKAPTTIAGDAGVPVAITIMIQDADGGDAASADATTVNLTSTNTTTGSFTSDGEAVTMITIPAGMSSAMVDYSDTRVGSTAIIVASDSAAGFDAATVSILVTTSMDAVDSVTVSPAMAKAGDVMITVRGTPGKTGRAAVFSVGELVTNASLAESATSPGTYTGTVTVVSDLQDGTHDVMATLGEASKTEAGALTIDTMMPSIMLTAPAADTTVANGGSVTITATAGDGTGSGIASVMADVSMLDSTQTDVALMMGADGSYSVDVAISDDNAAVNGSKTITVTAMDAAGNSAMAEAMVMLDNKMSFTSMIPAGTSLFHVPLDVDGLDTVGDLKMKIGDAADLAIVYDSATGSWNSRSDAVAITSSLGIILSMSAEATVIFDGDTWDGGTSTLSLSAGANLIGLPVNDPRVTNVSDIAGLFAANVVSSVIVSTDDGFKLVGAAGDPGDAPVMGDAAYLVTASAAGNAVLIGDGWTYSAMMAAPVALAGYNVEGQTAVLDVQGTVVDEISGLAREGFRVKVKNLSTKAALSSVSSVEAADGYNMTFVDLKAGNAARIGDVLEISADSPNPLIGVQPVRHIVTVDDVKNSTIQLEELIAYEIPAETELLRNYPNPFNPETWIPYRLAQDADVSLTIYDTSGTLVRSIDIGHQTAAVYDTKAKAIYWDGRNRFGEQVASGLYFYHLSAGDDFSATRRMVILK